MKRVGDFLLQHKGVIGYIILAVGLLYAVWMVQQNTERLERETEARQAFDDRRQYELCLSGNEARQAIADAIRGSAEDIIAVSQSEPDLTKTPEEKARTARQTAAYRARIEKRVAPLKPRHCVVRPQNSAGPQRP